MSRRQAFKRLLIGVVYVPLHYFVLYPTALTIGLVFGGTDVALEIFTDKTYDVEKNHGVTIWDWTSENIRWIFTGQGTFNTIPQKLQ